MAIERVEYWLDIAQYDLDTAEAMYTTKRWLYVGFMCHQVLEKTLKAYWCKTMPNDPPYIHNLLKLAQGSGIMKSMSEEQITFISEMLPLNIESRYPSYKEALARGLTEKRCREIIDKTTEMSLWIRKML